MSKDTYINKLRSHLQEARIGKRYSIQRLDIIIIALSTGGIIVSFQIVDFLIQNNKLTTCPKAFAVISLSLYIVAPYEYSIWGLIL